MTSKLHKLLRPFLLRRLKADVEKGLPAKTEVNMYIPMSKMQKLLYGQILKKDVDAINGKVYCYMCPQCVLMLLCRCHQWQVAYCLFKRVWFICP